MTPGLPHRALAVLGLAAVLVLPCPCCADEVTVEPRATFRVEYTDNLFLDPDPVPDGTQEGDAREPESDLLFIVTGGLTALREGNRSGLSLSYDLGHSSYREFGEQDGWRHDARLRTWSDPGHRTHLEFGDDFVYSEDPLTERYFEVTRDPEGLSEQDPTSIPTREPYSLNTATLDLDHTFPSRTVMSLQYLYALSSDSDPAGDEYSRYRPLVGVTSLLGQPWHLAAEAYYERGDFDVSQDLEAWDAALRLDRELSPNMGVFGRYEHREVVLDEPRPVAPAQPANMTYGHDYRVDTAQCGIDYAVLDNVDLSLSAGYFSRDYKTSRDLSGFSGGLNLVQSLRRANLRLYVEAGPRESFFTRDRLGPSTFLETGLAASFMLTRVLSARAFASFRGEEYDAIAVSGTDDTGLETQDRDDESTGGGIALVYAPRDWISADLQYTYRNYDSSLEGLGYTENGVALMVRLTSPGPVDRRGS